MKEEQFYQNIGRICRNDREGLREIYEDYCPMIYSVIAEIVQNREDAEDVTSDFFIRLWEAAGSYRPGKGHRAWMITIAHNMAIDYLRRKQREIPADDELKELHGEQASCEERICDKLSIKQAMDTLRREERQVVNLKIMGELTFREIAGILKKPQGTVAWYYQRAIKKLKEVQL